MCVDSNKMTSAIASIRDAEQVADLQLKALEAVQLLGIGRLYSIAPLVRDTRTERTLSSLGFSRVWERHYRARLAKFDPLPILSLDFPNAFLWPDDVQSDALSQKQQRYLEIASRYGHRRIIGTACYGPHGRAAFLGAGWDGPGTPPEFVMLAVHQIGQTAFQKYCAIVKEDAELPIMSNRELDVLNLMCRGSSNPAMAEALGVSRSSIDAYIRRIFAKLEVNDRTAACVRAYSIGLVASAEVNRLVKRAQMPQAEAG